MAEARSLDARSPDAPRLRLIVSRRELDILRLVPARIRDVLTGGDGKVLGRLFPAAHRDEALEAEHRRLLGEALLERRLATLEYFERLLKRATRRPVSYRLDLTEAEVDLTLHVLNDLRIVLGTELGISENDWWDDGPDDPQQLADFHFLGYLSALQEEVLAGLSRPPGKLTARAARVRRRELRHGRGGSRMR